MSWAKDPKDLYDVRVHRKGIKAAEEMALKEKEEILKSQPWKRIMPEQEKYIIKRGEQTQMNEKTGKVKYSVDELTVAYILYGPTSKIYKAMQNGEPVSKMIVEKVRERTIDFTSADVERKLLERCLKREKELTV